MHNALTKIEARLMNAVHVYTPECTPSFDRHALTNISKAVLNTVLTEIYPTLRVELESAIRVYSNSLVDAVNASDASAKARDTTMKAKKAELDTLIETIFPTES